MKLNATFSSCLAAYLDFISEESNTHIGNKDFTIVQYTKVLYVQIKNMMDSFPKKAVEKKENMIGILNVSSLT